MQQDRQAAERDQLGLLFALLRGPADAQRVAEVPLGGGNAAEVAAALKRAAPYLRSQVAQSVRLRYAPVLHFQTDTSFDEADRIDQLLHSEKVARDLRAEPGDEEDGDGA